MEYKKSIFNSLRSGYCYLDSQDKSKINNLRIKTLDKVRDFVYSGVYTKYRHKDLFLELESEGNEVIAKRLGLSEAGVKQARKRISEDAYSVLGSDIIDRVLYQDEHICELVVDNLNMLSYLYSSSGYMFSDVKERLQNSYIGDDSSTFDLLSCKKEMLFLSLFTFKRFNELSDVIDLDKLNYIIRLLDNRTKNTDDRFLAIKYINSNKSINDLCELLKESQLQN